MKKEKDKTRIKMNIDSIIKENKHLNIFGFNAEKDCLLGIDKETNKVYYFYEFGELKSNVNNFMDLPADLHIMESFNDLIGCAIVCGYIYSTTNECDTLKFDL